MVRETGSPCRHDGGQKTKIGVEPLSRASIGKLLLCALPRPHENCSSSWCEKESKQLVVRLSLETRVCGGVDLPLSLSPSFSLAKPNCANNEQRAHPPTHPKAQPPRRSWLPRTFNSGGRRSLRSCTDMLPEPLLSSSFAGDMLLLARAAAMGVLLETYNALCTSPSLPRGHNLDVA